MKLIQESNSLQNKKLTLVLNVFDFPLWLAIFSLIYYQKICC